jgi:2-haloacid dehalogenase
MATPTPTVLVLDVNETLSDLRPLRDTFAALGAPPETAATWFAATLRDGFALTVTGPRPSFLDLAADNTRTLLAPYAHDLDAAAEQVVQSFRGLTLHADVAEGLQDLRTMHRRVVTLSNGAAAVADGLLTRSGVRDLVERVLTVDDAARWKPAPEAYRYAAEACGVSVEECLMVAAHPWDLHGASRAGMTTAWLNRGDAPYPRSFHAPDIEAESMVDLAAQLGAVSA